MIIRRIFAANNHYICRKISLAMAKYIYDYPEWPQFVWRERDLSVIFGEVRHLQGRISGQMNALGFSARETATLDTLTQDVLKSSEIEGEFLDYGLVRSSVARRLGINEAGLSPTSRHVEGVVEMMLDATRNYASPLTHERLHGWHAALFPTGYSGIQRIETGRYRTRVMQIVSGPVGRESVHYEAVQPAHLDAEMDRFLGWFNSNTDTDGVLKAAVAHFWFIIIHPFDDGNGRIARAITDMLLARAEGSRDRFYSMSARIALERKRYYEVLQQVQHSSGDITAWLDWFLHCLKNALVDTEKTMQKIAIKADFWRLHEHITINERQRLMLNKLLDGFEGKLQSSKWAKITKTSPDTALRDIRDLVEKGILTPGKPGGRSTDYSLVFPS